MLNRYPAAALPDVREPARPESGHHSKRATFRALKRRGKAYTELGFRKAFHSLEDDDAGYLRGAQINIANFIVRRKTSTGSIVLQQADFADIFSLTPRSRFFSPVSWRVRGGLERVYSDEDDRAVGHISGGGGLAWQVLEDGAVYSLLTGRLEANSTFTHWIEPALGISAGGLYHSRFGTGHAEFNSEKFAGGEYRVNFSFAQNLVMHSSSVSNGNGTLTTTSTKSAWPIITSSRHAYTACNNSDTCDDRRQRMLEHVLFPAEIPPSDPG